MVKFYEVDPIHDTAIMGRSLNVSDAHILLRPVGGNVVVLEGQNFGPDPDTSDNDDVQVFFSNPAIAGLGGLEFTVRCNFTEAHRKMRCTTPLGVGSNQTWNLIVGNQSLYLTTAPTQLQQEQPRLYSSFQRPNVSVVSGNMATDGSSVVTLTGKNFGPKHPANYAVGGYGAQREGGANDVVSGPLESRTHFVTCKVTMFDVEMVCNTTAGVGGGMRWTAEVGEQQSDLSTESNRYELPALTAFKVVKTAVGDTPADNATHLLSTTGGDSVKFTGRNLGPSASVGTFEIRIAFRAAAGTIAAWERKFAGTTVDGTSLETRENSFDDTTSLKGCEVSKDHVQLTCSSPPGVGAAFVPVPTIGGQKGPAPASGLGIVIAYTPPSITAVSVLDGFSSWTGPAGFPEDDPSGVAAFVRFPGTGSGSAKVTITGANFGPLSVNNTVGVRIANEELAPDSPLVRVLAFPPAAALTDVTPPLSKDDDFGSLLASGVNASSVVSSSGSLELMKGSLERMKLVNCRVTLAHVAMECEVPSGVGYNLTWRAEVGSQLSEEAMSGGARFHSAYDPPNVTAVALVESVSSSSSGNTGVRVDTLGGDVVVIRGLNFGPVAPANTVHAASFSAACGEYCATAILRDATGRAAFAGSGSAAEDFSNSSNSSGGVSSSSSLPYFSSAVAETYNFKASSCNVTEADTTMVCVVGPGVGEGHVWMVVVGGQASAFLLNGQTMSYRLSRLDLLHPVLGPSFPLDTPPPSVIGGNGLTSATRVTYVERKWVKQVER